MTKISAGVLLYRFQNKEVEVFLVHPGGPFWYKKDIGAWSIPKGLVDPDEDTLPAAQREFHEETGFQVSGHFLRLSPVKTNSGKTVEAWAVEGNYDASKIRSNTFTMEWPPHSGKQEEFPEVDRAAWFEIDEAKRKIHQGQVPLLEELERMVSEKRVCQ
jgi:predicted NUDIX family NTP pyrophosphohydrolase